MISVYTVSIFLITYLICSISPSIEICKKVTGEDIRNLGSGNAGSTNATRVMGRLWGAVVFILDILKVLLAYGIIYLIGKIFKQDVTVTLNTVFLIAATIGHCYPIYYAFKGGKGVLVCLTAVCLIDIKIAIVCLIAGLLIILITRMVSAGSIGGVLLFDIMILVMQSVYIIPALIVSAIILLKHKSNIHRIFEGQENKLF